MPVVPVSGVSKYPTGATDVPFGTTFSVTAIGPARLPAPVNDSVIVPVCDGARLGENGTEILSVAEAEPDACAAGVPDPAAAGSHGMLERAVHVTVPAPPAVILA